MAYGKTKMNKKLNTITEPGDDKKRRYTDPPASRGKTVNIAKSQAPKFRPKLTKGAR